MDEGEAEVTIGEFGIGVCSFGEGECEGSAVEGLLGIG